MIGGALKQPSASACKQGITAEQGWGACTIERVLGEVGDVAFGVAWDGQNAQPKVLVLNHHLITIGHERVGPGNRFATRGDDLHESIGCLRMGMGDQVVDAASVIGVVVGDQDGGQLGPRAFKRRDHRPRIPGVHNGDGRTNAFSDHPDIVVLKCSECLYHC